MENFQTKLTSPPASLKAPCWDQHGALYTGDLSEAVNSASLYMYAYDTTIYCIGESLDSVSNMLNNTLKK